MVKMVELRIDMKGGGLKWCKKIIRGEWGACISFFCFFPQIKLSQRFIADLYDYSCDFSQ